MYYNHNNTSKYKYAHETRATQALARSAWRCHMALSATSHPRGLAQKIPPFCHLFNVLIQWKIENKSK